MSEIWLRCRYELVRKLYKMSSWYIRKLNAKWSVTSELIWTHEVLFHLMFVRFIKIRTVTSSIGYTRARVKPLLTVAVSIWCCCEILNQVTEYFMKQNYALRQQQLSNLFFLLIAVDAILDWIRPSFRKWEGWSTKTKQSLKFFFTLQKYISLFKSTCPCEF